MTEQMFFDRLAEINAAGVVLDTSPTVWPVVNHTRKHSHHIEIYLSLFRRGGVIKESHSKPLPPPWLWRLRAGNGQVLSRSHGGYTHKRDLVRGLELATGMLMLDQDRGLEGPEWFLFGCRLAYDDWLKSGEQATRFVEGAVIPVRVPEGTQWGSRRQR